MLTRQKLVSFLDDLFGVVPTCTDSSNNGLQVEGRADVRHVMFGVDASLTLFEAAAAESADFVVVHHGISWRDSLKYLTGLNARRVRVLFENGMSLYASHLPLDAHPEVGNNTVIARCLGLEKHEPFCPYGGIEIGRHGRLPEPVGLDDFLQKVNLELNTDASVLSCGPAEVTHIGIVSGGGADAVYMCPEHGIDCLITGEVAHTFVHPIRELGLNVIAAGHYRTEVTGVKAVMERVSDELDVTCTFIDLPTGY